MVKEVIRYLIQNPTIEESTGSMKCKCVGLSSLNDKIRSTFTI